MKTKLQVVCECGRVYTAKIADIKRGKNKDRASVSSVVGGERGDSMSHDRCSDGVGNDLFHLVERGCGYDVFHSRTGINAGRFDRDMDGYYKYWPADRAGFWVESELRATADLLGRVNARWDARVRSDLDRCEKERKDRCST